MPRKMRRGFESAALLRTDLSILAMVLFQRRWAVVEDKITETSRQARSELCLLYYSICCQLDIGLEWLHRDLELSLGGLIQAV